MGSAVQVRTDYSAAPLRRLARISKDTRQSRRLLSLAAVLDGMNRTDAARIGGMDRQTLRDWVHRCNEAGPDGLLDTWSSGPEPRLSPDRQAELADIVETGPDPAVDGMVRWRRVDLQRIIKLRFGVDYHERHISTLLKRLGFSHMSARPRHPAQNAETIEAFKKTSRARSELTWPICRLGRAWRSGSRMKRASARRMASSGSGPDAAHVLASLPISDTRAPTSSARSVRPVARELLSRFPMPIPTPSSSTSTRSAARWLQMRKPCCSWTTPDGTPPPISTCRTISRPSSCLPERPNRTPSKISGNPFAPLAFQSRLRHLRRHHQCSLRGLEQARSSAADHHLNRNPPMDQRRSISIAASITMAISR